MSFPAYESYKDSGVEWLGVLPSHWSAKRLSLVFGEIGSGTTPPDDANGYYEGDINWVTTGELRERAIHATAKRVSADALKALSALRVYAPGTLLIAMYGATIGRLGWLAEPACTNQACCAFADPIGAEPRFVYYVLQSGLSALLLLSSGGGQPNINQEKLRAFRVPFPQLSEQRAIAAFLDRETAKIDALVEAQERLIALLKEKRQAVISHAVTKGLAPSAPMKDSGVEWLGHVPAHWEVSRLAHLFREIADPGNDDLPVLSVSIHTGVSDGEIDPDDADRKITRSEDRSKYKSVQPGDLVYNMMRAWQGGFGTVTTVGAVSPAYVVARPMGDLETQFVELLLRTPQAVEEMRARSRGITDFRLRLYWEQFREIVIAVPSKEERRAILGFVLEEARKMDALASQAQAAIALLQERRAALISAAVTGKIDVRSLTQTSEAA